MYQKLKTHIILKSERLKSVLQDQPQDKNVDSLAMKHCTRSPSQSNWARKKNERLTNMT